MVEHARYDLFFAFELIGCKGMCLCLVFSLLSWSTCSSGELGWIVKIDKQCYVCGEEIPFTYSCDFDVTPSSHVQTLAEICRYQSSMWSCKGLEVNSSEKVYELQRNKQHRGTPSCSFQSWYVSRYIISTKTSFWSVGSLDRPWTVQPRCLSIYPCHG
jgi:hypothetical protein